MKHADTVCPPRQRPQCARAHARQACAAIPLPSSLTLPPPRRAGNLARAAARDAAVSREDRIQPIGCGIIQRDGMSPAVRANRRHGEVRHAIAAYQV